MSIVIHLPLVMSKKNKSYHTVKQFKVNYKLKQKVSQIIVTVRKKEQDILVENNGTRIRACCFPKNMLCPNFDETGLTQTLSAKNEFTEILLHFIGSRILMNETKVKSVRWITTKIPRTRLIGAIDLIYQNIYEGLLKYDA
jgi:hypothetical protein